ncbi:MAG: hypothetical protein R3C03_09170 [Pirellulaceae bacterium]
MSDHHYQIVAETIRSRSTTKILSRGTTPCGGEQEISANQIQEILATAGWAPFHHDRNLDGIAEPWRVHVFSKETCQTIGTNLSSWFTDLKPGIKIGSVLQNCSAMILINWLPVGEAEIHDAEKRQAINLEHHAASSSFVQNVLLLLTAAGHLNYWASGGPLASQLFFQRYSIPINEQQLAAVIVAPTPPTNHDWTLVSGKLREKRADVGKWARSV